MGSALLDNVVTTTPEDAGAVREIARVFEPSLGSGELRGAPTSALRRQVAERVAAHRSRRMGADFAAPTANQAAPRNARSAKIAAAVAERYAQTQTYHDFLAAEAERAVQQARAAAEVAALNAQALAVAQQRLLDAIEIREEPDAAAEARQPASSAPQAEHESLTGRLLWPELETEADEQPRANRRKFQPPSSRRKQPNPGRTRESPAAREAAADVAAGLPDPALVLAAGITIRLYQDESGATRVALDPAAPSISLPRAAHAVAAAQSEEEARLLDEEIAFRQEPVFEEPIGPAEPLPANLIEFPRQLVATRKARPRLAEGPMRAEAEDAPGDGQLRIFEVDPVQIAVTPESNAEAEAVHPAQWTSIWLDSRPLAETLPSKATAGGSEAAAATSQARSCTLPGAASVKRRVAAAAINTAILGAAFAAFATVFLWTTGHMLPRGDAMSFTVAGASSMLAGGNAIGSVLPFAACAFALLVAIYQALFFTFSTATPGMRAARIALCTFRDENPTRAAIRRRLPALLLSALPMGFGFLWAMLDEERLAWHDRICGVYMRSY